MRFAAALVSIACAAAQPKPGIGVYLGWVSTYTGNPLAAGAALAKSAGFHAVRLALVDSENSSHCGQRPLAVIATLDDYSRILGDPAFQTIFLTTWGDSHSYNPCQPRDPRTDQHPHKLYLQKSYYTAQNRERMRAEYSDLAYRLYEMYSGTGKTFVISNWEGDNELYCDAAAYFATKPSFRAACESKRATSDVLDAYREYLTLRHEGIAAGRERALRHGFKNVSVSDMIEFSSFRFLKQNHLKTVLDDVIPLVPASGLVSYSAWESLGEHLHDDLRALKTRFGDRLVIGEFGFDRGLDRDAPEHAVSTIAAIRESGILTGIIWQIFDQPPLEGLGDKGLYGLYDGKGRLTPTGVRVLNK